MFGFNGLGEVSYEKELKGETGHFEKAAQLSKATGGIVVCGCVTNTLGHKRKSAVVAECGRLLGVADRLHSMEGDYACGATLSVYDTKIGKIGVLVGEDLYFPETLKALALCGSRCILCPFDGALRNLEKVYLRAYAHCFGVPIYICGKGYCALASPKGELAFSSPVSPVSFSYEGVGEYRLIETRRRFGCST